LQEQRLCHNISIACIENVINKNRFLSLKDAYIVFAKTV
jgi:hypothetical protein